MKIDRVLAVSSVSAALIVGASMLRPDYALAVAAPAALAVSATAVPLNRDDPGQTRIGDLEFRGAVHLRSADPRFGGISGLRAGNEGSGAGNRLLAVTDNGNWLAFDTVETGGRLTGVTNAVLASIPQQDGRAAANKTEADAEALDLGPGGTATVAYEQDHRLAHFTGVDPARPETLTRPPARIERLTAMTGWPQNGGSEAMAHLPDGTRIVISEAAERPEGSHAALVTRAGKTREFGIAGVPDHRPTDAIALDATRILVLHRRFTMAMGAGAAISVVDLAPALGADPPATLPGRVIARWQPPLTLDNMEGMALRRQGNRRFLYLVSDDNLSSLQRTLLMKFELPAGL